MSLQSSSHFWHTAQKSGLLADDQLHACLSAIPVTKRDQKTLDCRLARQAIDQGYLTLWQAHQLLQGKTRGYWIDRYLLLDRIGSGGMGRVFLASDTKLDRLVALKILSSERGRNPRSLQRFLREGKLGAKLQHRNLVRVFDQGEAQGKHYLVMEYVQGRTLLALIRKLGKLSVNHSSWIIYQIAMGLDHAFAQGMVHRDVNPSNILVDSQGQAKLSDLGLAIDLDEPGQLTKLDSTVGTFDYIPPEQAKDSKNVDIRSDIYSLGCTLYHAVAGEPPFPHPSAAEKIYAHIMVPPTELVGRIEGISDRFEELIFRMMKKDRTARFQRPRDVAEAIRPFFATQGKELPSDSSWDLLCGFDLEFPSDSVSKLAEIRSANDLPEESGNSQQEVMPQESSIINYDSNGRLDIDLGPDSSSGTSDIPPPRSSHARGIVILAVVFGMIALAVAGIAWADGWYDAVLDRFSNPEGGLEDQDRTDERPISFESLRQNIQQDLDALILVDQLGGRQVAAKDLPEAFAQLGRGQSTIRLSADQPFELRLDQLPQIMHDQEITIQGDGGRRAQLLIDLSGVDQSHVFTRPGAVLRLNNLDLQFQGMLEHPIPAIFTFHGDLDVSNCWFHRDSEDRQDPLTRLCQFDGLRFVMLDSSVQGFEAPLEIRTHARFEGRIERSILALPATAGSTPSAIDLEEVHFQEESSARYRLLTLRECTIVADDFTAIRAKGYRPGYGLRLVLESNRIRARNLLSWFGVQPKPDSLQMRLSGNQLAIDPETLVQIEPTYQSDFELETYRGLRGSIAQQRVDRLVFPADTDPDLIFENPTTAFQLEESKGQTGPRDR